MKIYNEDKSTIRELNPNKPRKVKTSKEVENHKDDKDIKISKEVENPKEIENSKGINNYKQVENPKETENPKEAEELKEEKKTNNSNIKIESKIVKINYFFIYLLPCFHRLRKKDDDIFLKNAMELFTKKMDIFNIYKIVSKNKEIKSEKESVYI